MILAAMLALGAALVPSPTAPQSPTGPQRADAEFVANAGQWAEAVRYRAARAHGSAWILDRSVWLVAERGGADPLGVALEFRFEGGNRYARPAGQQRLPTVSHFLRGDDPSQWRRDVPAYASLRTERLYPGTDLVWRQQDGCLEYDLVLQPGADLARVRVRVAGHDGLATLADGSLVVATALGELRQTPPRTWIQHRDGRREPVACRFVLAGADAFGFAADWHGDGELVIDPGLVWGSYFGGSGADSIEYMAPNAAGQIVVVGTTQSNDLPTTAGSFQPATGGNADVFVGILSNDGSQRVSCTYYGGSGDDVAGSLQILAQDRIAVGGTTSSTNLPTNRPFQSTNAGLRDGFAAVFDATAGTLEFGTYFGSSADQMDVRVGVLENANTNWVYVAGRTVALVPTTLTGFQRTMRGPSDLFLGVIARSGASSSLQYGSLYGGDGDEVEVTSIHVAPNGIATMGLATTSTNCTTTATAYQATAPAGPQTGFIVCLDPALSGAASLVYASWFGGNGSENGVKVEMDPAGFFTVVATTTSTNMPATPAGPFPTSPGGATAGVACRYNPGAGGPAAILWMTYVGGSGDDTIGGFHWDVGPGILSVCGSTTSTNAPITAATAMQATRQAAGRAGFVCVFDPIRLGAAALLYGSYFDGCGAFDDHLAAVARGAQGQLTVAGRTAATLAPTTGGTFQLRSAGGTEGVVARLDPTTSGAFNTRVFGTGCGRAGFVPQITPGQSPRMCQPFQVGLSSMNPNSAAIVLMGLSDTTWFGLPLPRDLTGMGMPGCTQYVSVDATFVVLTGNGTSTFGFVTPGNSVLYGLKFFLQLGVLDVGANPFGVAMSNGFEGTLFW